MEEIILESIQRISAHVLDRCIGETDIDKTYSMPKSAVTYRKPRRLSDDQREAARKRARGLNQ